MVRLCLFILVSLCICCNKPLGEDDIKHLSGNWEIERVVFANGGEKNYTVNETVDRFELNGRSGVRKKVKPQFDGTFAETGQSESISIVQANNGIAVKYSTPFSSWIETISELEADRMVLITKDKTQYHYKRPKPFNIK